ncbi:MAG: polysaccharide deacetylase family protein [Ginsengibacter sp.]
MFYLVKTPFLLKKLYPGCVWEIDTSTKELYLTFDDGPHPEVTPFVLEELKRYSAVATFFCIGENVKKHFNVYKQIIEQGHQPANHTFNHLNGWKVKDDEYIENVLLASKIIDSNLFRPPYGRITKFQLKVLRGNKLNLTTVMWSVLSGDFDENLSGENCYLNVVNHAKPGSIIVFHDSVKAFERLKYALPRVLEHFSSLGYGFRPIIIR